MFSRLSATAALAVACLALIIGCSGVSGQEERVNPLAGRTFFVNPANPAASQAQEWLSAGRTGDARLLLEHIASKPTAVWLTNKEDESRAEPVTSQAAQSGETALLVLYYIPQRDCGSYSAGGSASSDEYLAWVRRVADGIGARATTVIIEPDALPDAIRPGCLSEVQKAERFRLLSEATAILDTLPNTFVYLDVGNSTWIDDRAVAEAVKKNHLDRNVDGFSLNVSNFETTEDSINYGTRLSRLLDGLHFVIDTSRNGAGPAMSDNLAWCNPKGRRLGKAPTTNTGHPLVDAYLWVKQPGESDGECHGGPAAGQWWPEYALGLIRRTS